MPGVSGVAQVDAVGQGRAGVEPDGRVLLEPGLWHPAGEFRRRGQMVTEAGDPAPFGVGQISACRDGALVGDSDGCGDGMTGGY